MLLSAEFVQKILVLICDYDHLAQSGKCCKATDKSTAVRGSTSSQDDGQMTKNIEERNVSENGSKVSVNILTGSIDQPDETKAGTCRSVGEGLCHRQAVQKKTGQHQAFMKLALLLF